MPAIAGDAEVTVPLDVVITGALGAAATKIASKIALSDAIFSSKEGGSPIIFSTPALSKPELIERVSSKTKLPESTLIGISVKLLLLPSTSRS